MPSSEDFDMLDVPVSSLAEAPLPLRENPSSPAKLFNGGSIQSRSFYNTSAFASKNTSREASVLANTANDLSIRSPIVSSGGSENGLTETADRYTEPLPYTNAKTGLCYDARMRFHTELSPPKDRSDYHPEDPRRILHIYRELCEAGLVEDPTMAVPPITKNPVYRIAARVAKRPEILLVHDEAHFDFLKSTSNMSEDELVKLQHRYDSIYFHRLTYSTALLSTGAAIETCLAVASGKVKNAIAVIRPPGHHAECDVSRGFCHFDNVSIATQVVRKTYPEKSRKVLIVDWDVHHGNGIQQAFESEPNVLYISLHVHENGNFYPSGPYGDMYHCGEGAGIGKNINIPWPTKGMGDADYLFAFQHIIMPVAFDFNPDLVIIAAGFDAAVGDQLGGCFVTPACYGHMTHMLMSLANGKLVVCLEGGYNLQSISKSALAVTKVLMGETPERIPTTAATKYGIQTVQRVMVLQSRYWRCLYPKGVIIPAGSERMHDIVRAYQSKHLYENHRMINLTIFREKISRSFDNQVLATANYSSAIPLLVIFHDPPEVIGTPNLLTNKLDLHNTWLADASKSYIEWAVTRGFGVIDVNIPKFLTDLSNDREDEDEEADKVNAATQELAIYLWENYIECNESTTVIFFGVGEAFNKAILHLLNTRNYEALQLIAGIVGFISNDQEIRGVQETFITDFAKWYFRNSLIFVEHDHDLWQRDRKPSRKFGQLKQSPADGINQMLIEHKSEVQDFLLRRTGLPIFKGPEHDGDTIMVAAASLTAK